MVVVKKVQSKLVLPKKEAEGKEEEKKQINAKRADKVSAEVGAEKSEQKEEGRRAPGSKKFCYFCKTKFKPHYWDAAGLRKYMNDRGRITARGRMGTCAKHQRCVSREIKHARHLALLPFTNKVR